MDWTGLITFFFCYRKDFTEILTIKNFEKLIKKHLLNNLVFYMIQADPASRKFIFTKIVGILGI